MPGAKKVRDRALISKSSTPESESQPCRYLVTLAKSLISEPRLHLYLSLGGNFENYTKEPYKCIEHTNNKCNLPFCTEHIPISNSSNMAIIITISTGNEQKENFLVILKYLPKCLMSLNYIIGEMF